MAWFKGKCGDEEAVIADFDQEMTVEVYVKNKGDCDVRIHLQKKVADVIPNIFKWEEVGKPKYVKPGESEIHKGKGVTHVRIECCGTDADGECRFRYMIDAD